MRNRHHIPLGEIVAMTDGDDGRVALADLEPGHDPVAVVHLLRLLHGPETVFDHGAFGLPLLAGFIEDISPCVNAAHRAGVGSVKSPERSVVRKECAMTHPDRSVARVDRADVAPCFAVVVAHAKPSFLRVGVLAALVVAKRCVEPPLVKTKSPRRAGIGSRPYRTRKA